MQDDILTVIRRVDQNWAEGMLGDKIGIFPISYVEVRNILMDRHVSVKLALPVSVFFSSVSSSLPAI